MLRRLGKNLNPLNAVDGVVSAVGTVGSGVAAAVGSVSGSSGASGGKKLERTNATTTTTTNADNDLLRKRQNRLANTSRLNGSQISDVDGLGVVGDDIDTVKSSFLLLSDGTFWPSMIFIALGMLTSYLMGRLNWTFLWSLPFLYAAYRFLIKKVSRIQRQTQAECQRLHKIESVENHLEDAEWLNFIFSRFWNVLEPTLTAKMGETIATQLKDKKPNFLESIDLTEFTLGSTPPQILGIQTYQKTKISTIHLDIIISFIPRNAKQTKSFLESAVWNNKILITAKVNPLISIPILIEDITFQGKFRVQIDLAPTAPFIDTITLCLLEEPLLDFSLRALTTFEGGMDISDWLEKLVQDSLRKSIVSPNTTIISMQPKAADHFMMSNSILKLSFKTIRGIDFGIIRNNLLLLIQKNGKNITYLPCINGKFLASSSSVLIPLNGLNDVISIQLIDAPFIINNDITSINGEHSVIDHVSSDLIGIHTFHSQDFSSSSSNEKWLHLRGRHSKELEIQTKSVIIPISDDTSSPDDASSPSSGILTIHLSQIKNVIDPLHPKKGGEVSCVYEIYLHSKEVNFLSNDPLNPSFYRSSPVLKKCSPTWNEDCELLISNVNEDLVSIIIKSLPKHGSLTLNTWTSKVSSIIDHSSWWEFDSNTTTTTTTTTTSNSSSKNNELPKFHSSFKFRCVDFVKEHNSRDIVPPTLEEGYKGIVWCQIIVPNNDNASEKKKTMSVEAMVDGSFVMKKMIRNGDLFEFFSLVKGKEEFSPKIDLKMSIPSTNEVMGTLSIDAITHKILDGKLKIEFKIITSLLEDLPKIHCKDGGCFRFSSIEIDSLANCSSLMGGPSHIKIYFDDLLSKEIIFDNSNAKNSSIIDCGSIERFCVGDEMVFVEIFNSNDQSNDSSELPILCGQKTMETLLCDGKIILNDGFEFIFKGVEFLSLPFKIERPSPKTGKLEILIIDCKNLMAVDIGGTSDPYIIIKKNGDRIYKTNIMKRQLNPLYNERTTCLICEEDLLELEVRDWNALQSSTLLGLFEVDLSNLSSSAVGADEDDWCVWNDVPLGKTKTGTISFKIRFKPTLDLSIESSSSTYLDTNTDTNTNTNTNIPFQEEQSVKKRKKNVFKNLLSKI